MGPPMQQIKDAGLYEQFKKHARWDAQLFRVADKDGVKVLEVGEGRDAPEIDRFLLRQIFLDAIPPEKIRWNHAVQSVTVGDHGPVVQFTNGATLSGCKLIVGADGAWSKVRPAVYPTSFPFELNHILTSGADHRGEAFLYWN